MNGIDVRRVQVPYAGDEDQGEVRDRRNLRIRSDRGEDFKWTDRSVHIRIHVCTELIENTERRGEGVNRQDRQKSQFKDRKITFIKIRILSCSTSPRELSKHSEEIVNSK